MYNITNMAGFGRGVMRLRFVDLNLIMLNLPATESQVVNIDGWDAGFEKDQFIKPARITR